MFEVSTWLTWKPLEQGKPYRKPARTIDEAVANFEKYVACGFEVCPEESLGINAEGTYAQFTYYSEPILQNNAIVVYGERAILQVKKLS